MSVENTVTSSGNDGGSFTVNINKFNEENVVLLSTKSASGVVVICCYSLLFVVTRLHSSY